MEGHHHQPAGRGNPNRRSLGTTDLPATTHPRDAFYPFDPGGKHGYVWHCHIIDHEDNEMMRPTHVSRNPAAVRTYVEGRDY